MRTLGICRLAAVVLASTAAFAQAEFDFDQVLKEFGHRNWVVVADSAYPAQTGGGIEVVYVGGDHSALVQRVLTAIDAAPHVRPVTYVDAELAVVDEADAPGVDEFRKRLTQLMADRPGPIEKPHGEMIELLGEAAKSFRVLVLKTDMTVPYTTVFIELNCGYWSAEQEAALRARMDQ